MNHIAAGDAECISRGHGQGTIGAVERRIGHTHIVVRSQHTGKRETSQGCYNETVSLSNLPNELSERGIWWQVAGFTLVAFISLAILTEYAGSDLRAYRYLEIAATKLYWAFVFPLGGLFEGARRMFEKASEIRAAQREKMRMRWTTEGRKEGRKEVAGRLDEAYARFGVEQNGVIVLPRTPEVEQFLFGETRENL